VQDKKRLVDRGDRRQKIAVPKRRLFQQQKRPQKAEARHP